MFNNERVFLKKAICGKMVALLTDIVTVVFENLEPGDYAVSVIHDRNNKLDSNRLGIPKEGFTFGNNAMGIFGPPAFDKAKIRIKDLLETGIKYEKFLATGLATIQDY